MTKITLKKLSNKLNRELQINQRNNRNNQSERSSHRQQAMIPRGISTITAPAAVGVRTRSTRPKFIANGESLRIRHREFVTEVYGFSGSFNINISLAMNPGFTQSFPWLSGIALNFEMYKFHAMRATIVPTVPTSSAGANYMLLDYDVLDPNPNKAQFLSGISSGSAPVWSECSIDYVPDADQGIKKFIRISGTDGTGQDQRLNDMGRLILATDGTSSSNDIGDLYIEYDVELFSPAINPAVAYAGSQHMSISTATSTAYCSAGVYSNTGPLLAYPIANASSGTLRLNFTQPGQYLIDILNGVTTTSGGSVPSATITSGSGAVANVASTINSALVALPAMTSWIANVLEPGTAMDLVLSLITGLDATSVVRIAKYAYSLN